MRRPGKTYREGENIEACNLPKPRVEDYARRVADLFGFKVGGDITEIVVMLGGTIHYRELDELVGENGSIFVHGALDFDILLPMYTSPNRDRFTIAHELGHYFLHAGQGKVPVVAYRSGSTRIEWEANWFAASLLMPLDKFGDALQEYEGDVEQVAFKFGVSVEAATVRKNAIGNR